MSGVGDLISTLGAVAPSALAGYSRGQARGLQYQQAAEQRRLANEFQRQQLAEQAKYHADTVGLQRDELAAREREAKARAAADWRDLLTKFAYGDGADERLYALQQAGGLPDFYGMLHEAGIPPPGGTYLAPGPGPVTRQPAPLTTTAPARFVQPETGEAVSPAHIGTLEGAARQVLPFLGTFESPLQLRPREQLTVAQPPVTEQGMLPARVTGAAFPKPAKVQAAEALAGLREQQARKAEADNLFLGITMDARLREAIAKGDLAGARALYEQLRPGLEQRRLDIQEGNVQSLMDYREGQLGESAANRASREAIAAASRASHEKIAAAARAVRQAQQRHPLTNPAQAAADRLQEKILTEGTVDRLTGEVHYKAAPAEREKARRYMIRRGLTSRPPVDVSPLLLPGEQPSDFVSAKALRQLGAAGGNTGAPAGAAASGQKPPSQMSTEELLRELAGAAGGRK
jgi:hypothetical protein